MWLGLAAVAVTARAAVALVAQDKVQDSKSCSSASSSRQGTGCRYNAAAACEAMVIAGMWLGLAAVAVTARAAVALVARDKVQDSKSCSSASSSRQGTGCRYNAAAACEAMVIAGMWLGLAAVAVTARAMRTVPSS